MRFGRLGSWLVILGIIATISCSKDDEPAPPESKLNVNGQTYDLAKAFFMNWGSSDCNECTDFDVWLLSDGIEPIDSGFVGTSGHLVLLDLNSSSSTEVAEGSYSWSITRIPSTIISYWVGTDCGAAPCSFNDFGGSGTATVTKSGENYQFDFDISLLNGGKATGTYFGTLEETTPFAFFVSAGTPGYKEDTYAPIIK